MYVMCSLIITKTFPQPQHFLWPGLGKNRHIWQSCNEPFEVRSHGFDLRLLKHDLADPHRVRIAGATPGKIARVPAVPAHQATTQLSDLVGAHRADWGSSTRRHSSSSPGRMLSCQVGRHRYTPAKFLLLWCPTEGQRTAARMRMLEADTASTALVSTACSHFRSSTASMRPVGDV